MRAFRSGIADFVGKRNLKLEEIVGAVRRAIALRVRDEVREKEVTRLREHAKFDELTGIHLRAGLRERLATIAETARRTRRHYGIVAFRLTRVGEVPGAVRVVAADRVLRAFGQKLREHLRERPVRRLRPRQPASTSSTPTRHPRRLTFWRSASRPGSPSTSTSVPPTCICR